MNPRVLVTGGFGYLGGRVSQALVGAGYSVACASRRLSRGRDEAAKRAGMQCIAIDWDSPESLLNACSGVDAIVHLAAMNELQAAKDPVGALNVNGVASVRLLEAAIAAGAKRFSFFSTAHVYGAPLQGHISEATMPRPQHPYAITHKVAEDFVLAAHDQKRIEGLVYRLSNGFGAPATPDVDRWSLLVNDLSRQAVTVGKLQLNSAGVQLRDFITLEDVARAVIHGLELPLPRLGDGLFNLGGDLSLSIYAMTEKVAARWKALTGKELPIVRPAPPAESVPVPFVYSCEKLKATGFSLNSNVDQEIDATLRLCMASFGK